MTLRTVAITCSLHLAAIANAFAQTLPLFVSTWGSEGNEPGQFDSPAGIAISPTGRVYVVDQANQRLQVFDADGAFVTMWGEPGFADGRFISPSAVAVDATGLVYVTDMDSYRVQKFDAEGRFIKKWGSLCQVPEDGECDGKFLKLIDIAIDASARVYTLEFDNHRVQKFDSEGNFLLKWGTPGSGPGQFEFPRSLAVDENGDVYVGDASRVQKFDGNGNFLLEWSGSSPVFCLGTRDGVVYACDSDGFKLFTSSGVFLTPWQDDDVPVPEKAERPVYGASMAFDASQSFVYLTDQNRVLKFVFEPTGVEPTTWSAVKDAYR